MLEKEFRHILMASVLSEGKCSLAWLLAGVDVRTMRQQHFDQFNLPVIRRLVQGGEIVILAGIWVCAMLQQQAGDFQAAAGGSRVQGCDFLGIF